ncbi:uncharacterized protein LOC129601293 [Paramacrobiotus metropolitanus]|uniref:uncharacterized protein LOC129601293 n=1 Tax=Paramacrobiotus metropolitanus TaxID=2943436 RepID=UPI00244587F4|nr:uncharacterized protein LOC129601293 [Paramacrobiotus metropolitanus]
MLSGSDLPSVFPNYHGVHCAALFFFLFSGSENFVSRPGSCVAPCHLNYYTLLTPPNPLSTAFTANQLPNAQDALSVLPPRKVTEGELNCSRYGTLSHPKDCNATEVLLPPFANTPTEDTDLIGDDTNLLLTILFTGLPIAALLLGAGRLVANWPAKGIHDQAVDYIRAQDVNKSPRSARNSKCDPADLSPLFLVAGIFVLFIIAATVVGVIATQPNKQLYFTRAMRIFAGKPTKVLRMSGSDSLVYLYRSVNSSTRMVMSWHLLTAMFVLAFQSVV